MKGSKNREDVSFYWFLSAAKLPSCGRLVGHVNKSSGNLSDVYGLACVKAVTGPFSRRHVVTAGSSFNQFQLCRFLFII